MNGRQSKFATALAILERQKAALAAAPPAIARRYSPEILADVEAQFLWGVYSALSHEREDMRAELAGHLSALRDLSLAEAREKVRGIEALSDQAEPLFRAIAERGRAAVLDGSDRHFIEIISALSYAERV